MNDFAVLRKYAGVTIPELASQLGFPEAQITDWDEGRSQAPKHVIHVLDYLSGSGAPKRGAEQRQHGFPWASQAAEPASKLDKRTGAFTDNMKLPIHRWFRFSAGFSAEWVAKLAREHASKSDAPFVFDPFAGSGTALLAAQTVGVPSAGAERHPFVLRIARAKLTWPQADLQALRTAAQQILDRARADYRPIDVAPPLLAKCYSPESLQKLFALRSALEKDCSTRTETSELLWLALTAILRECSGVGTAQWQYVLPNKSKANVSDPYDAFMRRVEMLRADISATVRSVTRAVPETLLHEDDARSLSSFGHLQKRVSLVVTSPPYPNNYDYADATRLEMTFWGEVASWGDLHEAIRHHLIRSCSQHTAAERLNLDEVLSDPLLAPIQDELWRVCSELEAIRETKGGKKTYHTMIAAYFADLARVWRALRPLCSDGSDICFVVGDSAPYGVHVPVDRWLASLAVAEGFHAPRFEKIRDRNLKWKNRKHRVPLKEGRLWLRG